MFPIIGVAAAGVLSVGASKTIRRRNISSQSLVKCLIAPAVSTRSSAIAGGSMNPALARVTGLLTDLDDRYQHFFQRQVNSLTAGTRRAQWQELTGRYDVLEISPEDRFIGRRIARLGGIVVTAALARVYAPFLIFTLSLALYDIAIRAHWSFAELKRARRLKMEHLIFLFASGLWLMGYFIIGGLSLLFSDLVTKVTLQTQDRTRREMINVLGAQPRTVWVLVDGVETELPFEQLQIGDTLIVHAGQMIPVDGTLVQGQAAVDQHRLTGESQPVEKGEGDAILAATVVLSGKIHVRVERAGETTLAAQIGDVLENTLDYHLSLEDRGKAIADRWATPSLLITGLAGLTLGAKSALAVISNMPGIDMMFLGPITLLNYLNLASRNRILIKDGRSLELLHKVDTVVFDKTGTLTLEQPHVHTVHTCAQSHVTVCVDEDTVLAYAAAAEQRQSHPIARAILAAAEERNLVLPAIGDAHYEMGYGLRVWVEPDAVRAGSHELSDTIRQVGGETPCLRAGAGYNPAGSSERQLIRVGSERFMNLESVCVPAEIVAIQAACHEVGHSLVMVAVEETLVGAIELRPTIRPEARMVVEALHQRKLTTAIISGDQDAPTRRLAAELGIDRCFGNVLPEEKAELVGALQADGKVVCFVGDGINDTIALKKAEVSISLRGATTIATDTAQIVLLDESLQSLPTLFDLAHELHRNITTSLLLVTVPCCIVIGGVFFFNFGVPLAVGAYTVTFTAGVINAMSPMFRRRLPVDDR